MKNRPALFSAIASLTLLTLCVFACGDDDSSEFGDAGKPDTSVGDTGPGFNTDSKASEKDTKVSCIPAIPSDFKATFKTPTHQDACEFKQLTDYYANCLANDPSGNAKLQTTDCSNWKAEAANTTCAACIETTDNSGPVQIFNDRLYYGLNSAGCVAIEQKNGAEGSCAEKYDTAATCRRTSCQGCLKQTGAVFADFLACQSKSIETGGDCVKYQTESNTVCVASGYKDAGTPGSGSACFGRSADEAQGDVFVRVEKVFCGKP